MVSVFVDDAIAYPDDARIVSISVLTGNTSSSIAADAVTILNVDPGS